MATLTYLLIPSYQKTINYSFFFNALMRVKGKPEESELFFIYF